MTLVKTKYPWSNNSVDYLFSELENSFNNTLSLLNLENSDLRISPDSNFPKHDVYTNNEHLLIVMDIPSVYQKDNVIITFLDGKLNITGEKSNFNEKYKDYKCEFISRKTSKFSKSFTMSDKLFAIDKISANWDGNVLEIKIPFFTKNKDENKIKVINIV